MSRVEVKGESTGRSGSVPPIRIVISYRREDTPGDAPRLHASLARQFGRENVFLDIDSIPAGVDWQDWITKMVSRCDVLLPLIGLHWLKIADSQGRRRLDDENDVLRFEIEQALKRKRVRVIPVLLHGAEMPRPDELPDAIGGLARRQSMRLEASRWQADVRRLSLELKEIQSAKAKSVRRAPSTPSRKAATSPASKKAAPKKAASSGTAKSKTTRKRSTRAKKASVAREPTRDEEWTRFVRSHQVGSVVTGVLQLPFALRRTSRDRRVVRIDGYKHITARIKETPENDRLLENAPDYARVHAIVEEIATDWARLLFPMNTLVVSLTRVGRPDLFSLAQHNLAQHSRSKRPAGGA